MRDRLPKANAAERPSPRSWMDPCCDYVVFEAPAAPENAATWAALQAELAVHGHGIVALTTRREGARRQLALKLDPDAAEAIKRAILEMKLAEDIVVFVYHRFRGLPSG